MCRMVVRVVCVDVNAFVAMYLICKCMIDFKRCDQYHHHYLQNAGLCYETTLIFFRRRRRRSRCRYIVETTALHGCNKVLGGICMREWGLRYRFAQELAHTVPAFFHVHDQEFLGRYILLDPCIVSLIDSPHFILVQKRLLVFEHAFKYQFRLVECPKFEFVWSKRRRVCKAERPVHGCFCRLVPALEIALYQKHFGVWVFLHQRSYKCCRRQTNWKKLFQYFTKEFVLV